MISTRLPSEVEYGRKTSTSSVRPKLLGNGTGIM
jgi:hypothetical protein